LSDIEKELGHYKDHFKDKVVYCNCDDPYESNFFKYFASNFNFLWLKKLIATSYYPSPIAWKQLSLFDIEWLKPEWKEPFKIEINEVKNLNNGATWLKDVELLLRQDTNVAITLKGNWDFRSEECIEFLKQADIVVTNPPFSLFREYVAQLIKYNKKFIIIWNDNAVTYKWIFNLIKDNKLWLWCWKVKEFRQPNWNIQKFGNIWWYTNLEIKKRHEDLILYKTYKWNEREYLKYDNYDAIEVPKITNIPIDYNGVIWVPITFLNNHNPEQFELLGSNRDVEQDPNKIYGKSSFINWKETFKRIFIKNKKL